MAIGQVFGQTKHEPYRSFPNLSNGKSFENELAKYLDMAVFPREYTWKWKRYKEYKQHSLFIQIFVDKNGNAVFEKADNLRGEIPINKIESFLESQKFETSRIPDEAGTKQFSGWIRLMNKSKREAKKEGRKEILAEKEAYKKRLVTDSINGLYIPQNLEECFIELSKILKPEDIETINNLNDRSETILFHHGLGTWMRNNWGLWGGSRLQQYLIKKGIKQPDNMSATILEFYYDWLHGQHDKWREFEAK